MANTSAAHVNRTYRSTVFVMLFEEKGNLLELYNAMSGKHRAEVRTMSIFEYDQEKHMRQEREQAWEEGIAEGEKIKLRKLIQKKLQKGKTPAQIAYDLEEDQAVIEEHIRNM